MQRIRDIALMIFICLVSVTESGVIDSYYHSPIESGQIEFVTDFDFSTCIMTTDLTRPWIAVKSLTAMRVGRVALYKSSESTNDGNFEDLLF